MVKVMYLPFVFVVISASFCFSQEGLFKTETKPSLIFGYGFDSRAVQTNSQLQPLSFYASYKRPLFNSFIANALIMQTESETLQSKTSFWKQAGIYGLEFVGASAGSCVSLYFVTRVWNGDFITPEPYKASDFILGWGFYVISSSLVTSSITCYIGGKFNQTGSWVRALIGGCVGSITTFWLTEFYYHEQRTAVKLMFFTTATLPSLGAVVGYNL